MGGKIEHSDIKREKGNNGLGWVKWDREWKSRAEEVVLGGKTNSKGP